MLIQWSDEYLIGFEAVDDDHRELFKIINDLDAKLHGVTNVADCDISDELDYFARYVKEHFDREEVVMRDNGFSHMSHHLLQHTNIRRAIVALRKIYAEQPELIDPGRLTNFLAGWLKNHILREDMEYKPFLNPNYRQTKSQLAEKASRHEADMEKARALADTKLETVQVQVPATRVDLLNRCAAMLRAGGAEAEDLVQVLDPVFGMTREEMRKYAGVMLKRPQN